MSTAVNSAAITLDLDAGRHYHAIHGLPAPAQRDALLQQALPRFLDMCTRLDVRATLFCVTQDLVDDDTVADIVRTAARDGHEIASHSHTHAYDLAVRAPAEIEADVQRSKATIARVCGVEAHGFRAPGYNLSEPLLDALEKSGFRYDSSVLPTPAYFLARRAAIALHARRGRTSASMAGDPRAFIAAPRAPYRPRIGSAHAPARTRVEGRGLLELPITTLPGGIPFFGTALVASPLPVALSAAALAAARRPCVLELHAIDLVDADDGLSAALTRMQPGLRIPLHAKLARLEAVLRVLARTCEVKPLGEIARAMDEAHTAALTAV